MAVEKAYPENLLFAIARGAQTIVDDSFMVTLVCGNAYPYFDYSVNAVGGGMELRAALFGRGLAALGQWHVSFVVSDFGQPFVTSHEGIDFHIYQPTYRKAGRNVFPRFRKRCWFPSLEFKRSDLGLIWQIPLIAAYLALPALFFTRFWRKLKPDVVCCFGNNDRSAEVIADCHRLGIKTILCVASDRDILADYRPGNRDLDHNGMPKWKGHFLLATADCIVAQTEYQSNILKQVFGRQSVLIRNPVQASSDDPQHWLPYDQRKFILWIGRADKVNKRPMLFLELAQSCPDLQFLMIVSCTDDDLFQELQQTRPNNLMIMGHVPQQRIWDYLNRAQVLVNTSRFEGFPNTFLQSAVTGTPIISLEVDPDGMLTHRGCGICTDGDKILLQKAVVELCGDTIRAGQFATNCHQYVLEYHEAKGRIHEFVACLKEQMHEGNKVVMIPWWRKWQRFIYGPFIKEGGNVN